MFGSTGMFDGGPPQHPVSPSFLFANSNSTTSLTSIKPTGAVTKFKNFFKCVTHSVLQATLVLFLFLSVTTMTTIVDVVVLGCQLFSPDSYFYLIPFNTHTL